MTGTPSVIHPSFHHVNLKTTRLQEMIDFYRTLVGAEVIFQFDGGAWLSNDAANHRIALLAFPNLVDDPDKETRTGMHHSAFEYSSFEDLIIRGGHNIDPATIEDALLEHPAVTAAAAVGRPDPHSGEVPVAFVTLSAGSTTSPEELAA